MFLIPETPSISVWLQVNRVYPFCVQAIVLRDPLSDLSEDNKALVWHHRYLLSHYPEAITKVPKYMGLTLMCNTP